jgi:N-acetyl-gamma-glutamyl-phosphate reductase
MDRGILTTIYVNFSKKVKMEDVLKIFKELYQKDPFVRIYPKGSLPNTKDVRGSNFCDIGIVVNESDSRGVIVTAIDNLVKGASGQAVQDMNIMLGYPEMMGLDVVPLFP